MNSHVDPQPQGSVAVTMPSSRHGLTERDERLLALREEGATAKEIGAALGITERRVVERVTELRKAGHVIRNVARERALRSAPRTFTDRFCAHRVYVVAFDPASPSTPAARPGPNAEALRQHREAVERRQRMAAVSARPPSAVPASTRIVRPAVSSCRLIDRVPSGEQMNAHVLAWLWMGRLARAPFVQRTIMVVARHFGLDPGDITGPGRTMDVVLPRQIAMYLVKTSTKLSLLEIGRRFGGRDHTTVLHAFRKIEGLACRDPDVRRDIKILRALLENA